MERKGRNSSGEVSGEGSRFTLRGYNKAEKIWRNIIDTQEGPERSILFENGKS